MLVCVLLLVNSRNAPLPDVFAFHVYGLISFDPKVAVPALEKRMKNARLFLSPVMTLCRVTSYTASIRSLFVPA